VLACPILFLCHTQVQLAERVSRDASVVQVYGAAAAADGRSMLLVMELMQVRVPNVHLLQPQWGKMS
jgi:hypothetical protein